MKLKIIKKVGLSIVDLGIREVKDDKLAMQLVERGLATIVEEEKTKKKEVKKSPTKKQSNSKKKKKG